MSGRPLILLLAGLTLLAGSATGSHAQRYQPIDVYIDSGDAPLAAYQVQVTVDGDAMIVGVEGGDSPAFAAAPHYDPKALTGGRIIIADLELGSDLPRGRTRVARLHVQITGDRPPEYAIRLMAAGNAAGARVPATVSVRTGVAR